MSVWQAREQGVTNFSVLVSHVLVRRDDGHSRFDDNRVQAFLGPTRLRDLRLDEYEPIVSATECRS